MNHFVTALAITALLSACSAQVTEPSAEELECDRYEVCSADPTALRYCLDGRCSCVTSNPGENRVASCATGEADGTYRNAGIR